MPTLKEKLDLYSHLSKVVARHSKAHLEAKLGLGHPQPSADLAQEITDELEQLGPTFIKLGQLLAGRSDLLPTVYHEALSRLHDDVEAFPYSEVEKTIREDFGKAPDELYHSFDKQPLATASLGQVHRAVTHSGDQVAVKVRRPGVKEEMSRDLAALADVADLLESRTDFGRTHRLSDVVASLRKSLKRELDYQMEGRNLERFRGMMDDYPAILIPRPHLALTSQRVLTMDFVDGQGLDGPMLKLMKEEERRRLADQIFASYLYQVLEEGIYHADPHPGNLMLTPDGRVALLDLGMVGQLTEEDRHTLSILLLQLAEGRAGKVASLARRMATRQNDSELAGFEQDVINCVNVYSELPLSQMKAGDVIMEICRAAGRRGLLIPPQLSMLAKTLLHLDDVGKTLDPNFNPNKALRKHASRVLTSSVSDWATLPEAAERLHEVKQLITEAPQQLHRLLHSLADQDYTIRVDAINEERWHESIKNIANRVTAGLILAALVLGSAILAHIDTPRFHLFGYPGIAIVTFLIAVTGSVVLAFKVLYSDELKTND